VIRVIAGALKGRRLRTPRWTGLRPTSDKLRETLFNILGDRVAGARVLDGFAGTGAMGIEALSRGAASVRFIEGDRRAAALVRENLAHCGVAQHAVVDQEDVARALRRLPVEDVFDVVILDPPYDAPDLTDVLAAAAVHLAPGGVLVLERATRREPPASAALVRTRDVKSGDSTLTFYTMGP